jgi:hypothetical protein
MDGWFGPFVVNYKKPAVLFLLPSYVCMHTCFVAYMFQGYKISTFVISEYVGLQFPLSAFWQRTMNAEDFTQDSRTHARLHVRT